MSVPWWSQKRVYSTPLCSLPCEETMNSSPEEGSHQSPSIMPPNLALQPSNLGEVNVHCFNETSSAVLC